MAVRPIKRCRAPLPWSVIHINSVTYASEPQQPWLVTFGPVSQCQSLNNLFKFRKLAHRKSRQKLKKYNHAIEIDQGEHSTK